jgi:hypothetical protein
MFSDQGMTLLQANVDSGRGTFAERQLPTQQSPWLNNPPEPADQPAPQPAMWQVMRNPERRIDMLV